MTDLLTVETAGSSAEFIVALSAIETWAYSAEGEAFMAGLTPEQKSEFVRARREISRLRGRSENAQLSLLAAEVSKLDAKWKAAAGEVKQKIAANEKTAALLNSIAKWIDVAVRILARFP